MMDLEALQRNAQTIINSLDRIKLDFKIELYTASPRQAKLYLEKDKDAPYYKINTGSYWSCDCANYDCFCPMPDGPQYLQVVVFNGEGRSQMDMLSEVEEVLMMAADIEPRLKPYVDKALKNFITDP